MAAETELTRRDRILDAAENAFAEFGFEGASLRDIVQAAAVNLATVYYYFESKEGLMAAVYRRRFDPLKRESLERLSQLEQEFAGQTLPVGKVIEAFVLPPLRLAASTNSQCPHVMRLIGRIVTEPNPQRQEFLRALYADVQEAFLNALKRSLPHLPQQDLLWRFEMMWGAMAYLLCNPRKIEKETNGLCNPLDTPTVTRQLVHFFSTGFCAPATPVPAT